MKNWGPDSALIDSWTFEMPPPSTSRPPLEVNSKPERSDLTEWPVSGAAGHILKDLGRRKAVVNGGISQESLGSISEADAAFSTLSDPARRCCCCEIRIMLCTEPKCAFPQPITATGGSSTTGRSRHESRPCSSNRSRRLGQVSSMTMRRSPVRFRLAAPSSHLFIAL
jgi:hypothetical protein